MMFSEGSPPAIDSARLYFRLIAADARSQMQYRASFVADVASTLFGMLFEFAAVVVLFQHVPALDGWSLWEVGLLYGTAELSLAIGRAAFAGFDEIPETVRLGTLDPIFTRPRSTFLQVLGSRFSLRQLGRAAQGALVLGVAVSRLQPDWSPADWALVGWTVAGGALFFGGLFVIGGTLAFWTVEGLEVMNILTYGGSAMASYPLSIYAEWMRDLFVFVVPLAFVNYLPALVLLDKPFPPWLPPVAPFLSAPLAALGFVAALGFWAVGIRHYQSTGH
jgi:ABC-2 type transport system permease protein